MSKEKLTPEEWLQRLLDRYPQLSSCEANLRDAYTLLLKAFRSRRKLLLCGNGGSAADSEHIVGELMKSFNFKRPIDEEFSARYLTVNGQIAPKWLEGALPAISLVSHTAFSTAFSNDESSIGVFAQQVYAYGQAGDVLLAISTSGRSANVIEAAKVARALDVRIISLTGEHETPLTEMANVALRVPASDTYKVQELHLPVYHCLCAMIESELFEVDCDS